MLYRKRAKRPPPARASRKPVGALFRGGGPPARDRGSGGLSKIVKLDHSADQIARAEFSFPQTVQPETGLRPYSSRYGLGNSRSMRRRTSSGFAPERTLPDVRRPRAASANLWWRGNTPHCSSACNSPGRCADRRSGTAALAVTAFPDNHWRRHSFTCRKSLTAERHCRTARRDQPRYAA